MNLKILSDLHLTSLSLLIISFLHQEISCFGPLLIQNSKHLSYFIAILQASKSPHRFQHQSYRLLYLHLLWIFLVEKLNVLMILLILTLIIFSLEQTLHINILHHQMMIIISPPAFQINLFPKVTFYCILQFFTYKFCVNRFSSFLNKLLLFLFLSLLLSFSKFFKQSFSF